MAEVRKPTVMPAPRKPKSKSQVFSKRSSKNSSGYSSHNDEINFRYTRPFTADFSKRKWLLTINVACFGLFAYLQRAVKPSGEVFRLQADATKRGKRIRAPPEDSFASAEIAQKTYPRDFVPNRRLVILVTYTRFYTTYLYFICNFFIIFFSRNFVLLSFFCKTLSLIFFTLIHLDPVKFYTSRQTTPNGTVTRFTCILINY